LVRKLAAHTSDQGDLRRRHSRHRDDRPLIHHAETLSLKGDSYRLKGRDLGPRLARRNAEIG